MTDDKPSTEVIQQVLKDAWDLIGSDQTEELDRRLGELAKKVYEVHPQLINANLRAPFRWKEALPNWYNLRDAAVQMHESRGGDVEKYMVGLLDHKRPDRLLTKEKYEEMRVYHLGWLWLFHNPKDMGGPIIGYTPCTIKQAIKYNQMALVSLRRAYYHGRMWTFTVQDVLDKYPD